MDLNDWISFAVGIIGTGIAIWQTAIINESKKRRGELQFLLAGINSSAIQKQQLWANQIALLGTPNTASVGCANRFILHTDKWWANYVCTTLQKL